MSGDNRQPRFGPDDANIAQIPGGEEAWKILDAVFDGHSTAEQRKRLEQMVVASPVIARLCLRAGHLWYGLQVHNRHSQVAEEFGLEHLERTEGAVDSGGLNETMILPALREAETMNRSYRDPLMDAIPPDAPQQWIYVPEQKSRRPWAVAAAAAIALFATGLSIWVTRPSKPPVVLNTGSDPIATEPDPIRLPTVATTQSVRPDAVITGLAAAEFESGGADPGRPLSPGQTMALTRGAAELTFDSGATVVVTAPARFQVVGRNAMVLDSGSIAAHVPPPAVGFRVQAPGLAVVDQGTNFGVKTDGVRLSETAVFDGKVEAVATNVQRQAVAVPVQLTAGQAVRQDASASASRPERIAFNPGQYNRDVAKIRVPLVLPASGENVAPGEIDPRWQLVSSPKDKSGTPRPLYATTKTAKSAKSYEKSAPGHVWLSPDPETSDIPIGLYVFRTTIDLSGCDPKEIDLSARVFVDNEIAEVRTNGGSLAVAAGTNPQMAGYQLNLSSLPWKTGVNTVDFVVRNTGPAGKNVSPTGLSISWGGSAFALVRR